MTVTKFFLFAAMALVAGACSPREPTSGSGRQLTAQQPAKPRTSREEVQKVYLRSCHGCHAGGVAGAPRTGDAKAWAPRLEQGMDTLVAHVEKGYKAMPPRGLCFDCSGEEYEALIRFMAEGSD